MRPRSRYPAFAAAAAIAVTMLVPTAGPAAATHPSDICLDVWPETGLSEVGEAQSFSARLPGTQQGNCDTVVPETSFRPESRIEIDFEITGPNDLDGGNTPETPDLSCGVQTPNSSCSVSYTGLATGTDTIRAWIDHDGLDPSQGGVVEADTSEQRADGDNDITDVVERTWVQQLVQRIDCDDRFSPFLETRTVPSGGPEQFNYLCATYDQNGERVTRDRTVKGEILNGINDPDAVDGASFDSPDFQCSTAFNGLQNGECFGNIPQTEGETGVADVCFWYGTAAQGASLCQSEPFDEGVASNGTDSANDAADTLRVEWQQRTSVGGGLDAETETEWGVFGEQRLVRGWVYDQFGVAFSGTTVINFELFAGSPSDTDGNTPGSPDMTCTTQSSTNCAVTYTQTQTAGRDLLCAWTNGAPAMSGTNTGGTCDGEGPVDGDDEVGLADAPQPVNDDVDVVVRNWDSQTAPTRLDCTPENTVRPIGSTLTITCTARNALGNEVANVPIDFEVTDFGDPDGANTPGTPDFTCTTGAGGTCSITHTPGGSRSSGGTTSFRAWIDEDGGAAVEADLTERRDEVTGPGDRAEPDITDVVENTMRFPESVDAELESTSTSVATAQTVSVTVYDNAGNPFVAAVTVKFEFFAGSPTRPTDGNTPASPDMTCTTSIQGTCSVSWKTKTTGVDRVCVWVVGTPTMAGTNTNPASNCGGEAASDDSDDAPDVFDAPTSVFDRTDVVVRTRS